MNVCSACFQSVQAFHSYSNLVLANQQKLQEALASAEYLKYHGIANEAPQTIVSTGGKAQANVVEIVSGSEDEFQEDYEQHILDESGLQLEVETIEEGHDPLSPPLRECTPVRAPVTPVSTAAAAAASGKSGKAAVEDIIFIDCETNDNDSDVEILSEVLVPSATGTRLTPESNTVRAAAKLQITPDATKRTGTKAVYICSTCNETFDKHYDLMIHQKKHFMKKLCIVDVVELSDSNLSCLKESGPDALILCKICDISNRAALKQLLERDIIEALGSIDILVNSAGIVESEVPDKLIGVNLTGVINSCLIALNLMSRAKGGKGGVIVNVASTAGLEPIPFLPTYCASKHGLIGFTRSLGVEPVYSETGVKFIIICPGGTRTRMFENCRSLSIEIEVLQTMFREFKHPYAPQSPDVVGACIVQAIVEGDNGSTWICNDGKIEIHSYPPSRFL
uniref:C2H2-type domain-containing protein n=1 Tax=Anopheles melas TaxID=34690 RepID=A0A182UF80_9DIPT